jgi:hypothetical protein
MGTCHFDNKTSSFTNAEASVKVCGSGNGQTAFIASSRGAAGNFCWPLGAPRLFPDGLVTLWSRRAPHLAPKRHRRATISNPDLAKITDVSKPNFAKTVIFAHEMCATCPGRLIPLEMKHGKSAIRARQGMELISIDTSTT